MPAQDGSIFVQRDYIKMGAREWNGCKGCPKSDTCRCPGNHPTKERRILQSEGLSSKLPDICLPPAKRPKLCAKPVAPRPPASPQAGPAPSPLAPRKAKLDGRARTGEMHYDDAGFDPDKEEEWVEGDADVPPSMLPVEENTTLLAALERAISLIPRRGFPIENITTVHVHARARALLYAAARLAFPASERGRPLAFPARATG
jgi:hypothetical protein